MDLEKLLISSLIFVFTVLFTPSMIDAIEAVSGAEPLKPLLQVLPPILVVITAVFPIWSVFKDE